MTWRRRQQFRNFDAWLDKLTGSGPFSSTFLQFCWALFSELYLFGLTTSRARTLPLLRLVPRQNSGRRQNQQLTTIFPIIDLVVMFSLLLLWIGALIRLFLSCGNLVVENLVLLRQQLAVLKRGLSTQSTWFKFKTILLLPFSTKSRIIPRSITLSSPIVILPLTSRTIIPLT